MMKSSSGDFSSVSLFPDPSSQGLPPKNELPLNKWYVIDPQTEANCYTWKAIGAKTLTAIMIIAAIALASSVVIFTFLAASGTIMPLGLALGSVAGAFLIPAATALSAKGEEYFLLAEKEERIAEIHRELCQMELEQINQSFFLQACGIQITEEAVQNIRENLPEEDKARAKEKSLLVLARFLEACEHAKRYKETFPSPRKDKNYKGSSDVEKESKCQRYWYSREHIVYPYVLTAIMLRAILKNPFIQESEIGDLGTLLEKSYQRRKLDKENPYFQPKKDENEEEVQQPPSIDFSSIKNAKKVLSSYTNLHAEAKQLDHYPLQEDLNSLEDQLFSRGVKV